MLIYSRIQAGINSDAPGVLAYGDLNFLMITTNKGQSGVVNNDQGSRLGFRASDSV
jgi:hypothetical protein